MTPSQLRSLLDSRDWTPADLAKRLRCSVRSVQYWLSGGRDMRGITSAAITHILQREDSTDSRRDSTS